MKIRYKCCVDTQILFWTDCKFHNFVYYCFFKRLFVVQILIRFVYFFCFGFCFCDSTNFGKRKIVALCPGLNLKTFFSSNTHTTYLSKFPCCCLYITQYLLLFLCLFVTLNYLNQTRILQEFLLNFFGKFCFNIFWIVLANIEMLNTNDS